ncbi:MAG: hypothetical protein ACE5IR_07635 [bacterium]
MPRKKKNTDQLDLRQRLTTATCVPALREKVSAWRKGGYKWQYLKVGQRDYENLHPDNFMEITIALLPQS